MKTRIEKEIDKLIKRQEKINQMLDEKKEELKNVEDRITILKKLKKEQDKIMKQSELLEKKIDEATGIKMKNENQDILDSLEE